MQSYCQIERSFYYLAMNKDDARLAKLQEYYVEHRLLPSFSVMGEMMGLRSKSSVSAFVGRMKAEGFLRSASDGRIAPGPTFFARALVGNVPAGFASPATELLGDAITIDEFLVEHPSRTILIRVKGDSMVDAGIHAGDFLVVERRSDAALGKIIVAVVDREYTIKYLAKDHLGYFLQPANPEYPAIRPESTLEIFGEVVGQFRKC